MLEEEIDGIALQKMVSCRRKREVAWPEIKKRYEISKDNYSVIEKEDIDNINLKITNTIEIKEFIDSEDFDLNF
jgi:non-homologous end joining protein Ku